MHILKKYGIQVGQFFTHFPNHALTYLSYQFHFFLDKRNQSNIPRYSSLYHISWANKLHSCKEINHFGLSADDIMTLTN